MSRYLVASLNDSDNSSYLDPTNFPLDPTNGSDGSNHISSEDGYGTFEMKIIEYFFMFISVGLGLMSICKLFYAIKKCCDKRATNSSASTNQTDTSNEKSTTGTPFTLYLTCVQVSSSDKKEGENPFQHYTQMH